MARRNRVSWAGLVAGLLALFFIIGCMEEEKPENDPGLEEGWTVVDPDSEDEQALEGEPVDESVVPGESATGSEDDVGIQAGCSQVQWCNEPANVGPAGSVCIWQGCTLGAALNECVDETWRFCGTPVCPWQMRTTSGQVVAHRNPCPGPRP